MPKSRLRGGAKAHRKRVQKRNNNIKNQQNRIQKIWEEELTKRMEELKVSGETEPQETDTTQPLDIKV
jgi:transposase